MAVQIQKQELPCPTDFFLSHYSDNTNYDIYRCSAVAGKSQASMKATTTTVSLYVKLLLIVEIKQRLNSNFYLSKIGCLVERPPGCEKNYFTKYKTS